MPEKIDLKSAPRISLAEAKAEFDRDAALFVDVRSHEEYDVSHIPGAASLPLSHLFRYQIELPRDRLIITY